MDLSLSKFRICAPPRLNVSWHPTLPIIRLLGVDMTVTHLTRFLSYWTSRYRLAHKVELVKKLEAALLGSHRFLQLLSTINQRWKRGKLPSGTTGGRILYRSRLDDARDQGRKLWRYFLLFLQHCQRVALEESGNEETEGWIDAGVERELEGEIFFDIFYDDYLFGPPTEGYDVERLLLYFDRWNDDCKTWVDAADALSRRTASEPVVECLNCCPRPQGQQTLPVTQTTTTRPQNSSGLSQVDVSEQTADDFPPVSPPTSPHLPSRPSRQSSLVIPPMRQLARPIQNTSGFNPAAPPGQAIHVVPLLHLVSNSRLASARRATRMQRLRRIPPRSGYFTPRPGRLGRLIQPLSQEIYTTIQTTCTNQNSSGINRVARPRQAPTIVEPSSRPAPSPYSYSTAAGASGETAPPRPAPSFVVPLLRPTLSPYRPYAAGWASGEAAPTRPAPTNVAPPLSPARNPCSPSPAEERRRKDDPSGTKSPPRERLNRLMREQFGVDLTLPPEERVFPEHIFMTVNGVHTLRPEKFPCLYATAEGSSGEIGPPRPAPTIVAPSLPPARSPRSPCPSGRASGEDGALGTPEQRIINVGDGRPVQLTSAVEIIDLEDYIEE